ncbi:MAG: hypothetical protein WKF96_08570 [Solirubrobacteraceae bacterium]
MFTADRDDDALISVAELALRWRAGVNAVAGYVADGRIPSLDGGELARRGQLDIPVVRPSWGERVRVDSEGASRRIDLVENAGVHPAARAAIDLHYALSMRDQNGVWALSSSASVAQLDDPEELQTAWLALYGDNFRDDTGVASGVYALVPHRGVGVRLVHGVGPLTFRYEKPTPVDAFGLLVLVEEDGAWRADLPLSAADFSYLEVLSSAPPEDWSRDDGPLP